MVFAQGGTIVRVLFYKLMWQQWENGPIKVGFLIHYQIGTY